MNFHLAVVGGGGPVKLALLDVNLIMTRPYKAIVVLLAVLVWAMLAPSFHSPEAAGQCLDVGGAFSISALWSPRVSIAPSALRELRDRMTCFNCPTGVCITGPFDDDPRAPGSVEEAWLVEKLYGPPQRWIVDIVPLESLTNQQTDPGEALHIDRVHGILVGVLTTKTVPRLSVELVDDAIRVYELDA